MEIKRVAYFIAIMTMVAMQTHCHAKNKPPTLDKKAMESLEFARSLGPAFMSGRISDLIIHPNKPHTWYAGVGSGGVWKTENAGVLWTPSSISRVSTRSEP